MIDLTGVQHHRAIQEIVDVLCNQTQNTDRGFFNVEVAFFLAKMAGSMRATIVTKDRGEIPVNVYVLALATSGFGKGHSVNIMETQFINGFKRRFMEETMPIISEQHLREMADERSIRNASDANVEFETVYGEYKRAGAYAFTFDSATAPAVKQMRHKLVLANCGSVNLQVDEIGSNLENSNEVLTLLLELYDQGLVKQKLTKNTAENTRAEEVDGKTPTNALLFGTPAKLLDGGKTEDLFYSFLDTGYARRCFFGWGQQERKAYHTMDAAKIYAKLTQTSNSATVTHWADTFYDIADPAMFGWKMQVSDAVAIRLLEYKIACEAAAEQMPDHAEIRKAELSHRYFKALKLAGALAFIDKSVDVTMTHLMQAILLTEESGVSFQKILTREKPYVKLAKYIATCETEVTHSDLMEALPFYKGSSAARNEMMTLATAWGYKEHIVIKKSFISGIEFYKGDTLKETNLDEIIVSYSNHWAYNYQGDSPQRPHERVPFMELDKLTQATGFHWVNHHFRGGHRSDDTVIPGFNMVVLDVDEGPTLDFVHDLLKDYTFMTYTTKRHQTEGHGDRFRIMIPINYVLLLNKEEYTEFMNNIIGWLPFKVDDASNQISKKWESYQGSFYLNQGNKLLDALPFIPNTTKNEDYKTGYQKVASMDNLERWFAQQIASNGNRNNHMIKFALALVDSGMGLMEVQQAVLAFNGKLESPLDEKEIHGTIMVSVGKRYQRT